MIMADRFGKFLGNVIAGTLQALAPGARFNAGLRKQSETLLLDGGGAAAIGTTIGIASLRGGDVPDFFEITAGTASLAGVSFAIGTKAAPTKYAAATVGPAAGATVKIKLIDAVELDKTEAIFATTSVGVLPVTVGAKLQFDTYYSHK
jgi:hypothetical protein